VQIIYFIKHFRGLPLEEVGSTVGELGFDGVDLLIRPGHQVEPGDPDHIPAAVRTLQQAGLSVPLATTDITDPAAAPTERIIGLCAEAGIGTIRLGFWAYDPGLGYRTAFETAQRHLDTLETMARRAGVRLAIQIHGGSIHSSGALTAALLAGRDPAHLGAYPDPANQVVQEGREDWRMTFDLLQPWLCCVGVKNGGWFPAERAASGQRHWRSDWQGLSEGMVPWDEIIAFLIQRSYGGLLSLHSHYQAPFEQLLDYARADLAFLRRLIAATRASD
jgi:sugar phosphate isomerase/epimerase